MDQSELQGNEQDRTEAPVTTPEVAADTAPPKAPRKRRAASAPEGAPPAPPSSPSEAVAAPVRKRATRARKPVVVTDETSAPESAPAAGVADPADTSAAAASPAPSATPEETEGPTGAAPARAPRTRRRAATAEAGPARAVEPAAPAPIGPGSTADAGLAQGPSSHAVAQAASTAPSDSTVSSGSAAAPVGATASGTSVGDGDAASPAEEKTVRTRRTATRSRRASEPVEAPTTDTVADASAPGSAPPDTTTEAAATRPATRRTSRRSGRVAAQGDVQGDAQVEAAAQADAPATGAPSESAGQPSNQADPAAEVDPADGTENAPDESTHRFDPFAVPESPLSLLFHAPDLTTVTVPSVKVAAPRDEDSEEDDTEDAGRRSRRSRRTRSRTRGDANADSATGAAEGGSDAEGSDDDPQSSGPDDTTAVTSRRRRRRRRGDQDLELTGGEDDDPPNTVTRVRAPRQSSEPVSDRVTSVRGSTRLEAKKQRRRESRDTGRRRQVITEAEFLARRESVDRQMIVRQSDDRIQIGVLEDGILAEHFVSRTQQDSLIGNVYLGKVQNVLPSMEAAFVDIGRGRNAVLYAGEVNWDAAGLDGQPRRIELALKSGDPVLVQVTKDPVGHKGARLTSQISLPGRYLVYVPGGSMTGISRKLPDVERNRLKRILKDRLPENAGVIVRTAAEGASEEELTHDINRLRAQWEEIERKSGSTKTLAPELLYGEPDLTIKVVRDVFNEDFSKLVVSGEDAWDTIEAYVMYVAPDLVGRLEKWTGEEDIFAASRIDEQIAKALERKVFLPSGGSLVIDRTEAMTVVDVNTGKFTGSGGNLEETVTKNNLEAAEEVVRQLRLRDIGGIIVIDFIDMVLEANRDLVLRRLVECLGRDRTKHQVAEVTSLGLVQMTRKRMGTGLLEVFGEDCEHCAGRGVVTHMEPVEHRHATPAPEQQQSRQDKMSRSERKRNRGGRGGQQQDDLVTPPAAPVADSPDRVAKAEAARAALASIAAATHHAHEESAAHGDRGAHTDGTAADADIQVTEAVLTINGETVTLPRATNRRRAAVEETADAPATRLTLDSLSEAFGRTPVSGEARQAAPQRGAGQEAGIAAAPSSAPAGNTRVAPAAVEEPPAVRSRPRRRVARSAQGAADTTIETQGAEAAAEPAGTRHVARAQAPVRTPATSAAEPLIFGVGVPASEL
ncbi:Rne/Rng family ribonuclease [Arthrobacter bussei]|uniref:Ribonuclease E n=1 Tax=Arthrobacter bussei TaxID=2594179 RepID=A0A7X1NQG0_9MICC|nr:Rne/Rng family ribonuclease [Arthrobacter bussei]MPY11070.1 Rne/Rng family ribonuclease [Arthrobacter bussei]